jgi:hypothetical protein
MRRFVASDNVQRHVKPQLYGRVMNVHGIAVDTYIITIIADLFFVVRHELARLHFFVVVFRHDLAVSTTAIAYAYIIMRQTAYMNSSCILLLLCMSIVYDCCWLLSIKQLIEGVSTVLN